MWFYLSAIFKYIQVGPHSPYVIMLKVQVNTDLHATLCFMFVSLNDTVYGFAGYLISNDDEICYKYIVG